MHIFYNPLKDASIYRRSIEKTYNTGIDEILEVQKYIDADNVTHTSRALIQFDLSDISASIVAGDITSPQFFLNLYADEQQELPLSFTIYGYPLSSSWEQGSGHYFDNPNPEDGVSWTYRDGEDIGTEWATGSTAPNTTSSFDGGGEYYTSSFCSASYTYETDDIRIDITTLVNNWLSDTIPNNGLILKHLDSVEDDAGNYGILQFFSNETNTIYPPTLEVVWQDRVFNTGSLSPLTDEDIVINVYNLKSNYKVDARPRFRVRGRERYPEKSFTTTNPYQVNKYLPTTTYYSILDAASEITKVPFSAFTQLSCDSTGNYFDLWLDNYQPERFYKIIFKVESSGSITYYDNNTVFKVER